MGLVFKRELPRSIYCGRSTAQVCTTWLCDKSREQLFYVDNTLAVLLLLVHHKRNQRRNAQHNRTIRWSTTYKVKHYWQQRITQRLAISGWQGHEHVVPCHYLFNHTALLTFHLLLLGYNFRPTPRYAHYDLCLGPGDEARQHLKERWFS